MQSTGIDPSKPRAWIATLTLRSASEYPLDALRFPCVAAQYPDKVAELRLGIAFPRTAQALCWQTALEAVHFAAPEWQAPGGAAELRAEVGRADAVAVETQWLNMREVVERHGAALAAGKQADAPHAWAGVYALAKTVGACHMARGEAAPNRPAIQELAPSSWRSVALKGLPFGKREIARQTEQRIAAHLLSGGGGPLLADLLTADPAADLAAALCIALAAAGLPWYAVTPVTDLAVTFAASVPRRARRRTVAPGAGTGG